VGYWQLFKKNRRVKRRARKGAKNPHRKRVLKGKTKTDGRGWFTSCYKQTLRSDLGRDGT